MKIIYGKESTRIDLTPGVTELSWSSSRGQIAQNCDIQIKNNPPIQSAGFLMLFSGYELKAAQQFFHGPIVRYELDNKTADLNATAYELSWYLQKNDLSRPYPNGDAGAELTRLIKSFGINFSCPALGFNIKERMSSQSCNDLYTNIMQQAYDKTGKRYYLQHQRDKLTVIPEGGNTLIPMFRANQIESSRIGESIEEVYTVVTVERYKDDKVSASATKENAAAIKQIGRMQKVIDAGEEKNLSSLAAKQLTELSKIPRTRSITVHHEDDKAAMLRAGWAVKIMEKDNKTVTDWIVTSCNARWKGGQYTMDLELEVR